MEDTTRARVVLVLSGPTGVGKTTLADWLVANAAFSYISTSQILKELNPEGKLNRQELQRLGNELDSTTDFSWISDAAARFLERRSKENLVVDAVRKPKQVLAIRARLGVKVVHCHLFATTKVLEDRHLARARSEDHGLSHAAIQADESEAYHAAMRSIADFSLESLEGKVASVGQQLLSALTDNRYAR